MAQISQVAGNGALMEDIGSQETVISSGGAGGSGSAAAAAVLGITADGVLGGNSAELQYQLNSAMSSTQEHLDDVDHNDDDEDDDEDDVETFNLDDVIEAVAAGTLG